MLLLGRSSWRSIFIMFSLSLFLSLSLSFSFSLSFSLSLYLSLSPSLSISLSLSLSLSRSLSLSLVCLLTIEHVDVTWSTIILQDVRSLAAACHPCRHPISDRSRFTWSSHRVRCAPLRLMPNWGSLSNTFLVGHEFSILITCLNHHILPAFVTFRMLGLQYSAASS